NRMARRVARSTIGAAPLAPVEQIIETYRSVFDRLAHEEQTQAVIMGGSKLSLNPRLINGRLLAQVDEFRAAMSAAAQQHRFPFFDTEPTVAGPERESYFMPDGVHRNERGHARLADMVYPVIAEEARRLGLVAEPAP
ncbi:MAG: SGNH/GDSL hydrolase family protein, partial [Tepidiformaceae bacterium]